MNKPWLLGGALLLSLAANVFMAGWLVGRPPMHMPPGQMEPPGRQGPRLQHLLERMDNLPDAQRRAVRQLMRDYAPQLRELGQQNKQAREALQRLIAQPELPRTELEAGFAQQRELQGQMHTLMQKMLLDIAEQLPPEQRARLLQREAR
jgi:Spy/CpxP family protein refolding chaperone